MEEIEANTPVPERCWALRNVAGTLTMGGPGERQRALTMLERALALKAPLPPFPTRSMHNHRQTAHHWPCSIGFQTQ